MLVAHIQVKNVPPALHEKLKRRAKADGRSLSAYVLRLVEEDLALPSQQEWLAEIANDEPVEGADVVGAIDAEWEEREQQLEAAYLDHRR